MSTLLLLLSLLAAADEPAPPSDAARTDAPASTPPAADPPLAIPEPPPAPPATDAERRAAEAGPRKRRAKRPAWHEPAAPVDLEVGITHRFGVGLAVGWPPSGTVKAFVDPRNAVALHVGTTLGTSGLHLRLQFEQATRRLKSWDWGQLTIGWQAGVAVDILFGQQATTTAVRPGVLLGANVELRLVPVPVGLFLEGSPVLYPFDLAARQQTAFFPVGLVLAAGGRWYF